MEEYKTPTERVELPSKGLVYPQENPLALGYVEMKYMTAKEEDIILNTNYIKNGTAIDKLLKSLIVTPIIYDDLITLPSKFIINPLTFNLGYVVLIYFLNLLIFSLCNANSSS